MMLPGLQTCPFPLFAVFADDVGNPVFERVAVFCVVEVNPETNKRVISACTVGEHVESCDFKPNFVSLTEDPSPEMWQERCQAKATAIADAKAKAKIIIPAQQIVGVHQ